MACRAVLFALADDDARRFLASKDDEETMSLVEEVEDRWDKEWLCELDKAWDGLHRCLTDGELEYDNGEYPLNHAILGGQQLYSGDDYIVAFVTPPQVKEVAQALQSLDDAEMEQRYGRINRENYGFAPDQVSDEDKDYVLGWFDELRTFYVKASDASRAVIFTVDQ